MNDINDYYSEANFFELALKMRFGVSYDTDCSKVYSSIDSISKATNLSSMMVRDIV